MISSNVTSWLGGPWSLTANIVAVDFILSTNLIDIAVYSNSHKKTATHNLISFDVTD